MQIGVRKNEHRRFAIDKMGLTNEEKAYLRKRVGALNKWGYDENTIISKLVTVGYKPQTIKNYINALCEKRTVEVQNR
jgi:hypothetical protein